MKDERTLKKGIRQLHPISQLLSCGVYCCMMLQALAQPEAFEIRPHQHTCLHSTYIIYVTCLGSHLTPSYTLVSKAFGYYYLGMYYIVLRSYMPTYTHTCVRK